jgi:hypothetical protein
MINIRNNLFKTQIDQIYCTIDSIIAPGVYLVKDQSNKIIRVESDKFWRVKEDVVVQSGRIVARATKPKTPKVYEV